MNEYRTRTEGTMVVTHERRVGSAGGSPPLAGLLISCLLVRTASSWAQPAQDEPEYPHAYPRDAVAKRFENERHVLLRKGVTHQEEGIGQPERHSIMVDMKDYTPSPREPRTDVPPAMPHDGATLVLDEELRLQGRALLAHRRPRALERRRRRDTTGVPVRAPGLTANAAE